jgi:hypothetical protein
MKNRLDRDCVLLDGKCDCWLPMKECKYLPVNVNDLVAKSPEDDPPVAASGQAKLSADHVL